MVFQEPDLKLAVTDLAFDVFHFQLYVEMHRRLGEGACRQAVFYSLLLHFRLLLHFFYGIPKQDDCCVEHFRIFPGFEAKFPPELLAKPPWARDVLNQLHKRLAHFTATRWTEKAPAMNYYAPYFNEVMTLIRAFEEALPGEVGEQFSAKLNSWKANYLERLSRDQQAQA
jgi:hypothetical protein